MGKQCIALMLFSLAILAHANDDHINIATHIGIPKIHHPVEKVTNLQFYVQDILSGPNPSNVIVAFANSTFTSPTLFGLVAVLDDPIRKRPDPSSEIVGRAQGFFALASLEETSIHMSLDLVFTSGEHNGSVMTVVGHNPYLRQRREVSIVGGSGAFRMARGFIEIRTVSLDSSTGDAFFEYNVTAFHY